MANNKVQLADGTTLIDLTNDTVTTQTMLAGTTAHAASGEQITGVVNLADAGTATPLVDSGTGSVGSSNDYAREDHIHPLSNPVDVLNRFYNTQLSSISALTARIIKMSNAEIGIFAGSSTLGYSLTGSTKSAIIIAKYFSSSNYALYFCIAGDQTAGKAAFGSISTTDGTVSRYWTSS